MIDSPNAESIHYTKINFEIAVCHRDLSSANEWEDKLSLLYLEEIKFYSDCICELEEIIKDNKNIMNRVVLEIFSHREAKQLEELLKEARKKYTKINQEWIDVQTARKLYSE